jgi:malic enzyme
MVVVVVVVVVGAGAAGAMGARVLVVACVKHSRVYMLCGLVQDCVVRVIGVRFS